MDCWVFYTEKWVKNMIGLIPIRLAGVFLIILPGVTFK